MDRHATAYGTFQLAGTRARLLMTGAQTGGTYCLLEMIKSPGQRTKLHRHTREEETLYVLQGALGAVRAGLSHVIQAGQWMTLPRDEPHLLANAGEGDARYLLLCTPAGFDQFVREAGEPDRQPAAVRPAPPSPAAIARMVAAAPRYGITLLGPDGPADAPAAVATTLPPAPDIIAVMGPSIEILAEFGPADADLCLIRGVMPPGAAIPLHSHPHPESFYVVSGELDVFDAAGPGQWTRVGPGAWVPVGRDIRHALRNVTEVPATAVIVTTMGVARFFRDLGRLAATLPAGTARGTMKTAPAPEAMQQFADLTRRHGFWRASAAENAAIGLDPG